MVKLIVHNAQIYDTEKSSVVGTALAVVQNHIFAVGDDREIGALRTAQTEVIDAGGRILLPAFTDSHTHFLGLVKKQNEVDLTSCRSLAEALRLVAGKVKETLPGQWVTGGGWNRNQWQPEDFPTRQHLDSVSTEHFIAMNSKDWHTLWVNTPVLQKAGISVDRPYAGARHFAIHPVTGKFTGVLEESIRLKVFDLIPPIRFPNIRESYRHTVREFYRMGFSAIHSMETPDEFTAYQEAFAQKEPGLRVFWYFPFKNLAAARELGIQRGFGSEFLQIAGVKIFVDGALGSQTAELLENYRELGHAGVEVMTKEALNEGVAKAIDANFPCAVHAIGDKAVRKTLQVFAEHFPKSRKMGLHHRIEHAQLVAPEDLGKFAKLKVTASVQPVHLAADIPVMQRYLGERARRAFPFRSLIQHGTNLIFGSDTPMEPYNPWLAIYTAMERRFQLDETEPPFCPEEKLSLADCLKSYTWRSARAVGMEKKLGCVRPGSLADFFVTDKDIFRISPNELKTVHSVLTVIDGKIVYRELE